MKTSEQLLENALLTQVGIEEGLCSKISLQLSQADMEKYPAVKEMLKSAKKTLEIHFTRLNVELDRITARQAKIITANKSKKSNVNSIKPSNMENEIRRLRISQMLEEDYKDLNLAVTGNTTLHSTALVAQSEDIANLALEHLENMNSIVLIIGELMPIVLAQELSLTDISK